MTTATIIPFPTTRCVERHPPNEKLVESLENFVRMARTGGLTCFYGFGFVPDGSGISIISDPDTGKDAFRVLGGLDRLASRFRQLNDL